jgi:hypothetical protein
MAGEWESEQSSSAFPMKQHAPLSRGRAHAFEVRAGFGAIICLNCFIHRRSVNSQEKPINPDTAAHLVHLRGPIHGR